MMKKKEGPRLVGCWLFGKKKSNELYDIYIYLVILTKTRQYVTHTALINKNKIFFYFSQV